MKIKKELINEIVSQARKELPNESCGYLLGKEKSTIIVNYPMTNADHSPEHFSFLPEEQFAAIRFAREKNLKILANWHSHPTSPSRPSEEDIRLAYDKNILYFILSLASKTPVLNAFSIRDGIVTKVELETI